VLENVSIKDNELWATHDAYGVGFVPSYNNVEFRNIEISGNIFDSPSFEHPIYIGESAEDDDVTSCALNNIKIHNNNFKLDGSSIDGYAVLLQGGQVEEIHELYITDNHMTGAVDIGIDAVSVSEGLYISNNSEFRNLYVNGTSGSIINDNTLHDAHLDGYIVDSKFSGNILDTFKLNESVANFVFNGNTCFVNAEFRADNANSELEHSINGVIISNNTVHQDLYVSNNLAIGGTHKIIDLCIEGNSITSSLQFAMYGSVAARTVEYINLKVLGNTIGDSSAPDDSSIVFGSSATVATSKISNNITEGSVSIFNLANSSFSGNNVSGPIAVSSTTAESIVSNNHIGGVVTFTGAVTKSTFANNSCNGGSGADSVVFVAAGNTDIAITGNYLIGDLRFSNSGGGHSLVDSTISGNTIDGFEALDGISATSVCGNVMYRAVTLEAVSNCVISENNIYSFSTSASLTSSSFVGNGGSGDFSVGTTLSSSKVCGNSFNSFTIVGNAFGSIVSDNIFVDAVSFAALDHCEFANNNINEGIAFSASGATTDSQFNGNYFGWSVEFTSVADCTFNGNELHDAFSTSASIATSVVTSNTFLDTFDIDTTTTSCSISNNIFGAAVTFTGAVTDAVFNGNRFDNAVSFQSIIDSVFSGNSVGTTFVVVNAISASTQKSAISNNFFDGVVTFTGPVEDSIFSDNVVKDGSNNSIDFLGECTELICSNNYSDGNIKFSSTSVFGSMVIGNSVNTLEATVPVNYSVISGNSTRLGVSLNDITGTTISSNRFGVTNAHDLDIVDATDSVVIGNTITGDLNISGPAIDLVIDGNVINTNIGVVSLETCSVANNGVGGTFSASSTVDNSTVVGNVFKSTFTITGTTTETTICGNHIDGTVTLVSAVSDSLLSDNIVSVAFSTSASIATSAVTSNTLLL